VTIFLIHHAEALGPDVDPQRPLSSRGLAQATALAAATHEAGGAPAAIWHSGKLRARQTAEAFLRTCNPFAEFKMIRGLRPDDPVEWVRDLLLAEERDVAVVGHMPHLPALWQALTRQPGSFPLHGMVALERTADGPFVERWRL
jgi:phosphohistidine phosphatase